MRRNTICIFFPTYFKQFVGEDFPKLPKEEQEEH